MSTIELRFVKRAEMDNIAPRRILQQRTREPYIHHEPLANQQWSVPKLYYGPWSEWSDVPEAEQ